MNSKQFEKELNSFKYNEVFISILILLSALTLYITAIIAIILINRKKAVLNQYLDCKNHELENELQMKLLELDTFTGEYIKEQYIERRDEVLLEQLQYIPIEYRYNISSEYKEELKKLDNKEKELIKSDEYIIGSVSSLKKVNTKFKKIIISGLNAVVDTEVNNVSIKNFESKKKKIMKTIEDYNNSLSSFGNGLKINPIVINNKIKRIELMLEYKHKVEEEKELLKEAREREKEEKKINQLLEKEIEKIESEKNKLARQKDVYFERLENEENEDIKNAILIEIEKLNNAVDVLNDNEKTLEEKKKESGAGYVYIISNIGSFGEGIYKIGMTRRDEPMDRVKELGNASVPFLFDVHALIYSKNAYELETQLHHEFASKRVNKVNNRKEFFAVDFEDIKKVVLDKYNGTVDFIETPEAIQYRETLLIEESNDNMFKG